MNDREELMALRRLAELEAKARGIPAAPKDAPIDPSAGGSTLNFAGFDTGIPLPQGVTRALAGAGKAFADTGSRIQQLASYVGGDKEAIQRQIDNAKERDAPLMNTGAGLGGNILGNLALAVAPGAAIGAAGKAAQIPGMVNAARALTLPKTVLGAAGVGAAQGALQPVASDESSLSNMAIGAIGGAAVPAAIAGGRLVKDTLAPFTRSGAERIAGRALERFAENPANLRNLNPQQFVPGSVPTLAEATADPGIAQLQRTLANQPDVGPALARRAMENTNARVEALRGIAGDAGKMDFFKGARQTNAEQLYKQAFGESATVTPWVRGEITKLQQRPAFRDAWKQATELAANDGVKLDKRNVVQVAHYAKMALDDAAEVATGNQQRAILSTRDKLVSLMESKDFAPSYREARLQYAADSAPINQMQIGQSLLDTLRPALADFGANTRANAAQYAKAVRDADATAAKAVGFRGAKMDRVMTPDQMATITGVAQDLGRAANAQEMGKAFGSNTAQNLVSQDILRQTLGPLGLPASWAEHSLGETLLRPASWAYKVPERKALDALGGAMLDPKEAERLLALALKSRGGLLGSAIPYSVPVGTAALLSLAQ